MADLQGLQAAAVGMIRLLSEPQSYQNERETAFNTFYTKVMHCKKDTATLKAMDQKKGVAKFIGRFMRDAPNHRARCGELLEILMLIDEWMEAFINEPDFDPGRMPRGSKEKFKQRRKQIRWSPCRVHNEPLLVVNPGSENVVKRLCCSLRTGKFRWWMIPIMILLLSLFIFFGSGLRMLAASGLRMLAALGPCILIAVALAFALAIILFVATLPVWALVALLSLFAVACIGLGAWAAHSWGCSR